MTTVLSPPPVRGTDGPGSDGDGLPPYVSNGLVGLRVGVVPWLGGVAVLNGLAGIHPSAEVECVPLAPYPLGGDLRLCGVRLSEAPSLVRDTVQSYDFAVGELTSRFTFAVDGVRARVTTVTFASRSDPTVVAQESLVEVDADVELQLVSLVDPQRLPGRVDRRQHGIPGGDAAVVDASWRWTPEGRLSSAGYAWSTSVHGAHDVERQIQREPDGADRTTYRLRVESGRPVRFQQLAAMVPEAVHAHPDRQAARLLGLAARSGFDELRRRNAAEWEQIWLGRLVLVGADERWQAIADAATFYLHTSVHRSSLSSTYIFGLAQWHDYHYYYGHVMWDVEAFAVPALLLTQPDAAAAVLDYRWRCLPAARHNAQMWGFDGAQFPWESSPTAGHEATPSDATAAMYEHHVSADVAHAFAGYARATGDRRFLTEKAWPVLAEVAQWIVARVTQTDRGYEIKGALGIAERPTPSDGSAFVVMSAAVALDDAIEVAYLLGHQVPEAWTRVRAGLALTVDQNGVILDHDGYHPDEELGATPAALAGLFPFDYPAPEGVQRPTRAFYLGLADRYVGSPMLSALYGTWAAHQGDRELSARLFEEGFAAFVSPRFNNVHEYRHDRFPDQPVAGPFTANLGGFLTGCLYGLTGLRVGFGAPEQWCQGRAAMPAGWDGIEVERLWVQGRPMHLEATHDQPPRLLPL